MNSEILIELLINGKNNEMAVQGKKFSFGLKVTNISKSQSSPFTIENIKIDSDKNQNVYVMILQNYEIEALNKNESKIIEIEEQGFLMYGLVSVTCSIIPKNTSNTIDLFQRNSITNEISEKKMPTGNKYVNFFVVQSSNEFAQQKASELMKKLTFFWEE
jgi:hypothetical protein